MAPASSEGLSDPGVRRPPCTFNQAGAHMPVTKPGTQVAVSCNYGIVAPRW